MFDTYSKKQRNNESYFRDYRSLNKVHFIEEFNNIDWNVVLALDKSDPNISFDSFFSKLDDLIKKHVSLKKVLNKQRKSKPWITKGIRRSIQQKNKILKQYINAKNNKFKQQHFEKFKFLRNKLVELIRVSKRLHFREYFHKNLKNPKEIWKGIRDLVSLKEKILQKVSF